MTPRATTCSRPSTTTAAPRGGRLPGAAAALHADLLANHNAFRRLGGTVNAATRASWGFEDRDACMRIPESDPRNLRIEHRLASADANPYLVLAAILAGLEHGLEAKRDPIAPLNDDRTSGADFPWICSMRCAPCNITR
jgi:glutamine synthetase